MFRNHFALRRVPAVFHDIARDRVHYEETLAPRRPGDYTTLRPNYDHPFAPDDLDIKGGSVPELIADDAMDVFRGRLPKPSRDSLSTRITTSFRPRRILGSPCRYRAAAAAA